MSHLARSSQCAETRVTKQRWHWAALGPAFVAAVAYVDPGNVAANLQAGARYGYLLTWVLVLATACAGLVQYLSAKLGLVTGKSLPAMVGQRLSKPSRWAYLGQGMVVAIATDMAEVVGGAIALNLLFDLPLLVGGLITGVVSMGLLLVQSRLRQSVFERTITALLVIIAIGFLAGLFVNPPDPGALAGGLIPRFSGTDSVMLATAMLGATVMPHAVYLHSALTIDRFGTVPQGARRSRLLRASRADIVFAMVLAGGVNIGMLLLAATALPGHRGVDTIEGAHAAVVAGLGPVIGLLFAIGLLVSGLASTSVGCYAGGVIIEGLSRHHVGLLARRLITLVPALAVLAFNPEPTAVLVISQVVLSFGLPFALIPLVRLTGDANLMGDNANGRICAGLAWIVVAAIVLLNGVLLVTTFTGGG